MKPLEIWLSVILQASPSVWILFWMWMYNLLLLFFIYVNSEAYSSSLDGTVIAWNINTLKVNRAFQLPCQNLTSIKLHNDQLWCCKLIPQ